MKASPVLGIDVCGATLSLVLAGGLVWYSLGASERTARMTELRSSLTQMQRDLASAEAQVVDRRRELESLRARLAQAERLPAEAPVAECQARLAELARDNNVRITSFLPLPDREYPGIIERRFTFEARGATPAILRFLKGIESDRHWVDIGYLSLTRTIAPGEDARVRSLSFAISMYSAAPITAAPQPSGT